MAVFVTKNAEETVDLGRKYALGLKLNDVVLLRGEMGAGKTAFVKGVALGLGIAEEVLSPTYAYMNDYSGKLYHFDCYRLDGGEQAEALGLTDYFYAGGVCFIEWPQNIAGVLPDGCKTVTIEKLGGDERRISYE